MTCHMRPRTAAIAITALPSASQHGSVPAVPPPHALACGRIHQQPRPSGDDAVRSRVEAAVVAEERLEFGRRKARVAGHAAAMQVS